MVEDCGYEAGLLWKSEQGGGQWVGGVGVCFCVPSVSIRRLVGLCCLSLCKVEIRIEVCSGSLKVMFSLESGVGFYFRSPARSGSGVLWLFLPY